jgi:hypothetical protein
MIAVGMAVLLWGGGVRMEVMLPWIEIMGLALLPFVFLWAAFRLRRARDSKYGSLGRIASAIIALPIWLFSLFLLSVQGCEEDRRLVGSPDGKHVARLLIWGSVPTGTSLRVIERRSWSPIWHQVSSAGSGGTSLAPIEPRISWSDNSHLVLDYPEPTDGAGFDCHDERVGDILIVCRTHTSK